MPIFKAYDIRGQVPDEFSAEHAFPIGWATARFLGAKRMAVGRDARTHSPEIAEALCRGILRAGAEIVDFGLISTPMLYFGVEELGLDGGVMVTASHNPGKDNGLKICREHAIPVGGDSGLVEIEALVAEAPRGDDRERAESRIEKVDLVGGYVDHVLKVGGACSALRVAIDCGNGMASVGLEPLLARLPLESERLYFEPDGRFPNHPADPLNPDNLRDLSRAVRDTRADFGVAFDGDGDRAIFVDDAGDPISADLIAALLARAMLSRQPGRPVLYDLRSSRALPQAIGEAGGVPERTRVGHSFIKAQMRECGALFAGELSGHYYFRFSDNLVADDGTAAFVALLDVLHREQVPLRELLAPLRRYSASGEINRRVADIPALIADLEARYADGQVSHLDGLSVDYSDWWFNLRASNTEPLVRLNLEAGDPGEMTRHRDRLLAEIDAHAGSA